MYFSCFGSEYAAGAQHKRETWKDEAEGSLSPIGRTIKHGAHVELSKVDAAMI